MSKGKFRRFLASLMLLIFGKQMLKPKFEGPLRSVAILAQEKLGDAILLTPLIKNLRRAYPEVQIHVITFGSIYRFFERDPNVDAVYRAKSGYYAYFSQVLKHRFDVLFNTKDHPSWTFLMHTTVLRARYKVGVEHPNHHGFFNYLIDLDFERHVAEKNCALLNYIGCKYSPEDCRPYLPPEEVSKEVSDFIASISGKKLVGINLSAGEPAREWPLDKWRKLLDRLGRQAMIFSMPDRARDKAMLESVCKGVVKSPGTKSLYEAGQIIRELELLISPDTSQIHVASCYNKPVVGLYRSDVIHRTRFAPFLIPNRQVVSPSREVKDISVDQVIAAIEDLYSHNEVS
ncbi:MAG: glycosyltransferase family 9 protein [Chlorobiales bacterium]|nr:glycosyltransferase family 9 protein [Chlorobiales bacterium]